MAFFRCRSDGQRTKRPDGLQMACADHRDNYDPRFLTMLQYEGISHHRHTVYCMCAIVVIVYTDMQVISNVTSWT